MFDRLRKIKRHMIRTMAVIPLFLQKMFVYADMRFIDRSSSSIYEGEHSVEAVHSILSTVGGVLGATADVLGSLFAGLFTFFGDSVYIVMGNIGMSLDAVIYGKVFNSCYMTDGVSFFTYDTTKGNVYGIVSLILFSVMTSIVSLVALTKLITSLVAFIYTDGGPTKRAELKSQIGKYVTSLIIIALAPKLLDLAIYVRDLLLYQVGSMGNSLVGDLIEGGFQATWGGLDVSSQNSASVFFSTGSDYSLVNQFRKLADGDLLNSVMYLASLGMTFYLACTYVGMSLCMVALVGFFPLAVVQSNFERGVLGGWIKAIYGILMVPIIDASLLLVPILFGGLSSRIDNDSAVLAIPFIQCVCCYSIIPARTYIRGLLGIQGDPGMEAGGLGAARMGLHAMKGLADLAKSGASSLSATGEAASQGIGAAGTESGEKQAEAAQAVTQAEMAEAAVQEESNPMNPEQTDTDALENNPSGIPGAKNGEPAEKQGGFFNRLQQSIPGFSKLSGHNGAVASSDAPSLSQMESQAIDQTSEENEARGAELLNQDGNDFMTPLTEEQMQGFSASQKAEARTDNLANGIERMNDYAGNLKAEMGEWDQKAGAVEKHIASLDQESVALRSEKAKLDAKPREQRSHEDMEQLRNVNAEIERVDTEKAAARQQKAEIQANKSKLSNEYNRVTKASGEAGKVLSDMKSYNRSKNIGRESEILDRMANIQNFDTPAFRNISAERRAELYEQRNDALQHAGRLERAGNLVGGTIGGVTGGAFGVMTGPLAEDFAKNGADFGRSIGNMAVKPYMDHMTARASREYEKNRVSYDGYESLFPDQKGVPINRSEYRVPVDYTTLPELFTPEKAKIGKDAYQWGNAYDEKEYYGRNAARVWDDSVTDPKRKEIMRDLLKNTYTSDLLKDAKETFRDSFYDEDMRITGLSRSEVIRKQKENFLNRQASICGNSLYDTLKHHGYLPEYLNGMHEGQEKMLKEAFVHEQGDFAKNLIQSYLTAMNVWPKEGEE